MISELISKLQTKTGIISTGIVSALLAAVYLFQLNGSYDYVKGERVLEYVPPLQIACGLLLIGGVVKNDYRLYVPWMISNEFFIYVLLHSMVKIIVYGSIFDFALLSSIAIIAYLGCALLAVQKQLDKMYKAQERKYRNVPVKDVEIVNVL
ncbi:uncharacterized protein LOC115622440 [Scaptodrosophila lebanonensis]|uniref:Uncharacterized protein LOC115622440 n=1 Tax=Drosophila lebanonensis TaxID=7225 RepID=A0A6J2TBB4_DROLE|nr:uncharacterized protein LOC115622440 [Scaptodrosophila lebanonensis]